MDPRVPAKVVYHTRPTKVYSSVEPGQQHVDLGDIMVAPAQGWLFPVNPTANEVPPGPSAQ